MINENTNPYPTKEGKYEKFSEMSIDRLYAAKIHFIGLLALIAESTGAIKLGIIKDKNFFGKSIDKMTPIEKLSFERQIKKYYNQIVNCLNEGALCKETIEKDKDEINNIIENINKTIDEVLKNKDN